MVRAHNTISIRDSRAHYARLWFLLPIVFFSLAASSYYWNEAAQYRTYLGIGLVLLFLGLVAPLFHIFHAKSK